MFIVKGDATIIQPIQGMHGNQIIATETKHTHMHVPGILITNDI